MTWQILCDNRCDYCSRHVITEVTTKIQLRRPWRQQATTLDDQCDDLLMTLEIFLMTSDDSIWRYLSPKSKVVCLAWPDGDGDISMDSEKTSTYQCLVVESFWSIPFLRLLANSLLACFPLNPPFSGADQEYSLCLIWPNPQSYPWRRCHKNICWS